MWRRVQIGHALLGGDRACNRMYVDVSVCERGKLITDAHLFFGGHPLLIDLCVITFGITGGVI